MTDAAGLSVEQLSQLIAAQGREALVERLRAAYTEAAAAHADIVSLDERRLEALVENAANNADGLQWRRALAGVASRELGVSVAEALSHPAVVRAQTELGAPSYEQSLTELITHPIPPPLPPVAEAEAPYEPQTSEHEAGTGYDDAPPAGPATGYEPVTSGAPAGAPIQPAEWEDEPDDEPVAVIDGQLELAPEPPPEPAPEPVSGPASAASVSEPEAAEETAPPHQSAAAPATQPENGDANGHADQPSTLEHARAESSASEGPISEELEVIEADDTMVELLPEPDPIELDTQLYEAVPIEADVVEAEVVETPAAAEPAPAVEPEPAAPERGRFAQEAAPAPEAGQEPAPVEDLRINAIHLGGVANLPTNREGLDLRLSSEGLDIMRGEDEIIGRLIWDEIEALEVPNQRRRRRNSQPAQARLVVRTRHGDASFEVPGYSSDELRDRVDLRLESYARH
jgi:hypothetical protein